MEALLTGRAGERCRAVVVVPARDEADHLRGAVGALARQVDGSGRSVAPAIFEVVLLLNNCADGSAELARTLAVEFRQQLQLHVAERIFDSDDAHVGMARRLLMDTAWWRLQGRAEGAILSTDADTRVAPDWVTQNLRALRSVDVVGGEICWEDGELERLPAGVRRAYRTDKLLQQMVAEVESLLDPLPEDPWPRHMHTFGASLGCTAKAYAEAGGLPVQRALEDVEFVLRARRAGARVRREPRVKVYTSGRMRGQVEVGLSGQLRHWQATSDAGQAHWVPSAELIVFRARWLATLRRYAATRRADDLRWLPERYASEVVRIAREEMAPGRLIARCAGLPDAAFVGERQAEAGEVLQKLARLLEKLRLLGDCTAELAGAVCAVGSEDTDGLRASY